MNFKYTHGIDFLQVLSTEFIFSEKGLANFHSCNYFVSTFRVYRIMKTNIIKIGNSRGIRIPQYMLKESGLKGEVEIEVKENKIIIKSAIKIREGWESAFQKMGENKDDILLDKDLLLNSSSWDNDEWDW